MIDLHTHTDRSDGTLTPAALVDRALEVGLSAMAITDHDTFAGYELAADPARHQPFDPKLGVGSHFVQRAQAHGVIVRVLGGDVIAFSPPLIITEAEIDALVERTARALDDTLKWTRSWR